MYSSKLILVEGIPGSGKSTTAQAISRRLTAYGVNHKWWYEEEKGHPVYMFHDQVSMTAVVRDLAQGNFRQLILQALEQWRKFARKLEQSDQVIVVDSCMFGYLTWSLFPAGASVDDIAAYAAEVDRILSPSQPSLIYFYQEDVAASLKHICDRRGGNTAERFIRQAADSKYGRQRELIGFEGMVQYWADFRALTDELFHKLSFHKISIETTEGSWGSYWSSILQFLNWTDWTGGIEQSLINEQSSQYAGTYSDGSTTCEVRLAGDQLFLDGGGISIWPNTRLLPLRPQVFDLESLPIQVTFKPDSDCLLITGPELFGGSVDKVLQKRP